MKYEIIATGIRDMLSAGKRGQILILRALLTGGKT
jgi:hypothetical protein